ncbi:MAG: hypothetical protein U5L04_11180 [Trueperaceae bacterium]|nr:hypothetical protein [Trueperaceae bacterium]
MFKALIKKVTVLVAVIALLGSVGFASGTSATTVNDSGITTEGGGYGTDG